MNTPQITFSPMTETDFPLMTRWLNQPHMRDFYQRVPITVGEVAAKYGPDVRGEAPTLHSIARVDGRPFGHLQAYRNDAYPAWRDALGFGEGVSVDLFIGESDCLGVGLGRAMLRDFVRKVLSQAYPGEAAFIGHEPGNAAALACSKAAGFVVQGEFVEEGRPMILLRLDH
jgi:aminoglycoside 6'-N-acetyltransferase